MRAVRARMSIAATAVTVLAAGCGRQAPRATERDAAGVVAAPVDGGAVAPGPTPAGGAAPVDAGPDTARPVLDGPLPAMTFGPSIRLPSAKPTRYRVGGHRILSVRLPDHDSQAALDAEMASLFVRESGCRITLATPTLVSVTCDRTGSFGTMDIDPGVSAHLAIGADHEVRWMSIESFFHPEARADELLGALAATGYRNVTYSLTPTGLVTLNLEDQEVAYPWRTLAPYLRADTPLGALLVDAGLPLAPPGTAGATGIAPTTAIEREDPTDLIADWWRLPAALRPDVRLFVPAVTGDQVPAWLWFPAGSTPATLGKEHGDAIPYKLLVAASTVGPAAELALARTREPVIVRDAIGTRGLVERLLPRGAVVAAARGRVGFTESQLGRGWAFVGAAAGSAGWVPGRAVVVEACAAALTSAADVELAGLAASSVDGAPPLAWFVRPSADGARTLALHALGDDCAVGDPLRTVTLTGDLVDLVRAPGADDDAGEVLVVVTEPDPDRAARVVQVFASAGDAAPIVERRFDDDVSVAAAVARRGDRLPIVLTSGRDQVVLVWRDGALVDAAATAAPAAATP